MVTSGWEVSSSSCLMEEKTNSSTITRHYEQISTVAHMATSKISDGNEIIKDKRNFNEEIIMQENDYRTGLISLHAIYELFKFTSVM